MDAPADLRDARKKNVTAHLEVCPMNTNASNEPLVGVATRSDSWGVFQNSAMRWRAVTIQNEMSLSG
jgi:hypothetical protein